MDPARGRNFSLYFSFFAPLFSFGGVQKYPRSSSTLVIANIVAYLQSIKEQRLKPNEKGIRSHYEIFSADQIECLAGDIVLEHPWTAPEGRGNFMSIRSFEDNVKSHFGDWIEEAARGVVDDELTE